MTVDDVILESLYATPTPTEGRVISGGERPRGVALTAKMSNKAYSVHIKLPASSKDVANALKLLAKDLQEID